MSVTSADPADLAAFLDGSAPLLGSLTAETDTAAAAYQSFVAGGSAVSGGLGGLPALVTLLEDAAANDRFVAAIAQALVAADTNGHLGPVSVADTAVANRLAAGAVGTAPATITVAPSALLGEPPTSGFADDPVCTATGNFFHAEVDLAFPGRSAALNLGRCYNALGTGRGGAFGPGWSSLADVGLVVGEGQVTAWLADGAGISFTAGHDGTWVGEARPGLALAQTAAGFELTDGPVSGYGFDAAGVLVRRWVSRANVVVSRDASGRIVGLAEESSGRSVALRWERGRVAAAVSSDGRGCSYHYQDGRLVRAVRPAGAMTYGLDASGRVASVSDADGVVLVANTYDDLGRVSTQTSPFGRVSTYTYGPGRVTIVAGEEGIRNAFVHDEAAHLVSMVDAAGRAMRMRYNTSGRMTGWSDRRGGRWELTWNQAGTRPVQRSGPLGWEESWERDGEDRLLAHHTPAGSTRWAYPGPDFTTPSSMVEPGGATTLVDVSPDDLATAITDADGVTVRLAYDADGQATSITDALGNTTSLTYDPAGYLAAWRNPSSMTLSYDNDAAGRVLGARHPKAQWAFDWSPAGRAVAGVDPAEGAWQAAFGPHGALASLSGGAGQAVAFAYDACGNLTGLVGADGRAYGQGFDGLGQIRSVTDPAGATWTYDWSPEGDLLAVADPDGHTTRRVTDALGRTVSEEDGAGRTWRREWGEDGRLAAVVDPTGRALRYHYDAGGRVVGLTDDGETVQELTWSAAGRLAGVVGPGGRTTYRYDAAGRLAGIADASGSLTLVLDVDGRVARAEDERGRVVTLERDEAGRVRSVTDRRGVVRRVDLDAAGRPLASAVGARVGAGVGAGAPALASAVGAGVATFSYDERGLLVGAVDAVGGRSGFAYDAAGRVCEVADPLGGVTAYGYDPAGRLSAITDALGQTSRLRRSAGGQVLGVSHGDGTGWQRWTDGGGLTSGYSEPGAAGPGVVIQRDAAGRPLGLPRLTGGRAPASGGGHGRFELDPMGLVSASPLGDLYRHDAAGQLVEWVPAAGQGGPVSYTYDLGGRLVAERSGGGRITYTYDELNRLVRRVDASGSVTVFGYDAAGRRVSSEGPEGRRTYRWDAAGRLASIGRNGEQVGIDFDNLGLPVSVGGVAVSWDLSQGWPRVAGIAETSYERDGDQLVVVDAEGGRVAVAVDWMGNAETVSDPWGRSEGRGVRLGYRSELCIDGLVWLGARVYDPGTRCFLSPDPLANPPGMPCGANPYHYAWNDPVSLVDPTGLRPLTQDEFEMAKHRDGLGAFGRAWEAMKEDPWGSLALGLTVVAGVALMFTPAAAIWAGILIGVGVSAGAGIATGTFNPRMVAFNGLLGGVTGGVGELAQGASLATQIAVGAATGAGGSVLAQGVFTGHIDWGQVALSGGIGGVASGVGAKIAAAREVNAAGGGAATRTVALDTDVIVKFREPGVQNILQSGDRLVATPNVVSELQNSVGIKDVDTFLASRGIEAVGADPGASIPATYLHQQLNGIAPSAQGNTGDALNLGEAGSIGAHLFVTADRATIGATFGLSGSISLPYAGGASLPFVVVR